MWIRGAMLTPLLLRMNVNNLFDNAAKDSLVFLEMTEQSVNVIQLSVNSFFISQ